MVREMLGAENEFITNIAVEYGNANEHGAIIEFQMETGLKVDPASFVEFEDWAGCSPDGYTSDGGGLEIKAPFSLRKSPEPVPFKTLADQPHYFDQVQFSLFLATVP